MGFFDTPEHRPPTTRLEVGDSVTGTITGLEIRDNHLGRATLVYTLDNGIPRWANKRLWAAFVQARADLGQTVTVTRLPDDPPSPNGMSGTNWSVTIGTVQTAGPGQPIQMQPVAPQLVLPEW
jgi:hypothetical protein